MVYNVDTSVYRCIGSNRSLVDEFLQKHSHSVGIITIIVVVVLSFIIIILIQHSIITLHLSSLFSLLSFAFFYLLFSSPYILPPTYRYISVYLCLVATGVLLSTPLIVLTFDNILSNYCVAFIPLWVSGKQSMLLTLVSIPASSNHNLIIVIIIINLLLLTERI